MSAPEFPVREPLTNPSTRLITDRWRIWLRNLNLLVGNSRTLLKAVNLTGQNASISTTAIPTDALAPGLYAVTTYARITTAAGVASSLTATLGWTESAQALTFSGSAMTGNTVLTVQSFSFMMAIDQATPITYATTYSSNPASAMRYTLKLALEAVDA